MKKIMMLMTIAIVMTGCASTGFKEAQQAHYDGQRELDKAEAQLLATPLIDLKMGPNGQLLGLTVGRQGSSRVQTAAPVDPNMAVLGKALDSVTTVGSIVAGGAAARGLANAVGSAAGQGYKYIQSPTVIQPTPAVIPQANITNTTTTTLSGSGVIGSGSYATPTTTTTSTDSHAVSNSNNPYTSYPKLQDVLH